MAYGIRMLVDERHHGWILQDGKPLLFSDKGKTETHAKELNAWSSDAQYIVRPWPVSQDRH
jgi:hypothetical protein